MGKLYKTFALFLTILIAMSCLILLVAKPVTAQSLPTPSVPEFTLRPIGPPYVENTTYSLDPNTGQIVPTIGYTNPYSTVEIIIKNQPFTPFNDSQGNPISMFYNIQVAVHNQSDSWISLYEPNSGNLEPSTPDSDYTNSTLWLNNGPLPIGTTKIDVQVESFIGYVHKGNEGYFAPWVFTGDSSGWSNTQTVTLPENTPLSTNSPPTSNLTSIPMVLLTVTVIILVVVIIILAIMLLYIWHRKTANLKQ